MKNEEKYSFSDFTLEQYRILIQLAKKNHIFQFFSDFNKDKNFILWRHDIDFSVHAALKLSKIEFEEGVKATYFIHLHSEFYNFLEKEITFLVKEILQCGHAIGLHFDGHYYDFDHDTELIPLLEHEKRILEDFFNVDIKTFSYHNPNEAVLKYDKIEYAGMINTYADYFKKNVGYCSDSNGYWRNKRIKDEILDNPDKPLQILTHPNWWQKKVKSPKEKIWNSIDERADAVKKNYTEILEREGRKIIDWND